MEGFLPTQLKCSRYRAAAFHCFFEMDPAFFLRMIS